MLFWFKNSGGLINSIFVFIFCLLFSAYSPQAAFSQLVSSVSGKYKSDGVYNLIIISVNALRADHLGCYGYSRNISPNIDELARDSIIFDRAIAPSYWTLPSLVSLFTSKYVCAHNVHSRGSKLNDNDQTLAQILKMYGYATAAFTCGLDTAKTYGLNRGFEVYGDYRGPEVVGSISDIMPQAENWLNENKNKRFFLFLQSYDTHPPYRDFGEKGSAKSYQGVFKRIAVDYNNLKNINGTNFYCKGRTFKLDKGDIDYITLRYDDCISYVDSYIGKLLIILKQLKLSHNTIIILCSDHGEELGERGTFNRFGNQNLYQEVARVPLIIHHPSLKEKGSRFSRPVELVDIMPTILDILGVPLAHELQGKSLAELIKNKNDAPVKKYAISEASDNKWMILRDDGWKLIYSSGSMELYDLNDDPGETRNLAKKNTDMQVSLMKAFFSWRQQHKKEKTDNYLKLEPELIENLRRAGYW